MLLGFLKSNSCFELKKLPLNQGSQLMCVITELSLSRACVNVGAIGALVILSTC